MELRRRRRSESGRVLAAGKATASSLLHASHMHRPSEHEYMHEHSLTPDQTPAHAQVLPTNQRHYRQSAIEKYDSCYDWVAQQ